MPVLAARARRKLQGPLRSSCSYFLSGYAQPVLNIGPVRARAREVRPLVQRLLGAFSDAALALVQGDQ